MKSSRILLADDHVIVAQGIAALLQAEFELLGTIGDGFSLIEAALRLHPDVVISDISMPGLSGLEALVRIRREMPTIKFIFLTMHGDAKLAAEALRAGASGYVLKHSAGDELSLAIREVLLGRTYLTPRLARDVLAALSVQSRRSPLTPRQLDVLRLVAEGKTLKEIAKELGISSRTVETHKYDMMQALGVSTTAELIRYAIEQEQASNAAANS